MNKDTKIIRGIAEFFMSLCGALTMCMPVLFYCVNMSLAVVAITFVVGVILTILTGLMVEYTREIERRRKRGRRKSNI